jgi:hypothetical protein
VTKSPVWTGFDPANFAQWNRLGKLPVIPRVKERTAPPGCVRAGLRQWQEPGHVRHGKHTTPTGSVYCIAAGPEGPGRGWKSSLHRRSRVPDRRYVTNQ